MGGTASASAQPRRPRLDRHRHRHARRPSRRHRRRPPRRFGVARRLRLGARPASPRRLAVGGPGDAVLVGAGDIGDCDTTDDTATAALVEDIEGTVFTAGDNAYPDGAAQDFRDCYDPTWGRLKDRTRPAPATTTGTPGT